MAAAYSENPNVIKALINADADLKAKDKDNWTPLHSAAASNVVHYLLHRPTEYNTASKNPDVIKVLIDAGANLEAQTIYGFTPLLLAAQSKNPGVIKVLIDAGANLEAQDNRGKMALKLATEGWGNENESAAVKVLIDAGARESQEGDGFGKAAAALLGGAAIMYAGKDAEDQEAVARAVREYMEDVLSGQPDGNINSATPPRNPRVDKHKVRCNRHFKISRMCVGKNTRAIFRSMITPGFTAWPLSMTTVCLKGRKVARP